MESGGGSPTCYLVIATWGYPGTWRHVEYSVRDESAGYESPRVRSCSTLLALLSHIARKHGVSSIGRIYVLGLDSVVDVSRDCKAPQGGDRCRELFCECGRDAIDRSFGNYAELVRHATDLYRCVLGKFLEEAEPPEVAKVVDVSRVVALPVVGAPGSRFRFTGDLRDFASLALTEVASDLSGDDPFGGCGSVRVVLDTSHGINYTVALAMRVSEITAELLRLRHDNVELVVYNSDPVSPRGDVVREVSINVIHRKEISDLEVPPVDEPRSGKWVGIELNYNVIKPLRGLSKSVIASIYSPAPLALAYACYDYESEVSGRLKGLKLGEGETYSLYQFFNHLVERWRGNVELLTERKQGEMTVVRRNPFLSTNFLWSLFTADAVCKRVLKLDEELESSKAVVDKKLGEIGRKGPPSELPSFKLELVRELAEEVYGRINSVFEYLIKNEYSQIELAISRAEAICKQGRADEMCDAFNRGEYVEYGSLKRFVDGLPRTSGGTGCDESRVPDISERNTIAHAGLLYDILLVNKDLRIRYSNKDVIEKVYSVLKNILDRKGRVSSEKRPAQSTRCS